MACLDPLPVYAETDRVAHLPKHLYCDFEIQASLNSISGTITIVSVKGCSLEWMACPCSGSVQQGQGGAARSLWKLP